MAPCGWYWRYRSQARSSRSRSGAIGVRFFGSVASFFSLASNFFATSSKAKMVFSSASWKYFPGFSGFLPVRACVRRVRLRDLLVLRARPLVLAERVQQLAVEEAHLVGVRRLGEDLEVVVVD